MHATTTTACTGLHACLDQIDQQQQQGGGWGQLPCWRQRAYQPVGAACWQPAGAPALNTAQLLTSTQTNDKRDSKRDTSPDVILDVITACLFPNKDLSRQQACVAPSCSPCPYS